MTLNPKIGELHVTSKGRFAIVGDARGTRQNRPGKVNWDWLIQWDGQLGYDEITHAELMEYLSDVHTGNTENG